MRHRKADFDPRTQVSKSCGVRSGVTFTVIYLASESVRVTTKDHTIRGRRYVEMELSIAAPDDLHLHLRDGDSLTSLGEGESVGSLCACVLACLCASVCALCRFVSLRVTLIHSVSLCVAPRHTFYGVARSDTK